MGNPLQPPYDQNDEIYRVIEEWLYSRSFDGEDAVASCIAETNSIFGEQYCEDISFKQKDSDNYSFTALVTMPHSEPRKNDVPYSPHDVISVTIEGNVHFFDERCEWHVNYHVVSASLNRDVDSEIAVTIISDADELICKLTTYSKNVWFRGHRDEKWGLKSFVSRVSNPSVYLEKKLRLEFEKQTTFLSLATYPLKKQIIYFQMQHHGVPTRLLDWSASPLIALYFAIEHCAEDENKDACIWVLNPKKLNEYHITDFPAECKEDFFEVIADNKIMAIHAPFTNLRMKVQKAEFTLHMGYSSMEDLLQSSYFLEEKIIIRHEIKTELRQKLTALGIDRASIYPDLDNISKTIKDNIWE